MLDRHRLGLAMTGPGANTWIPVQVAPATQRAYAADWHAFASWCQAHCEPALPVDRNDDGTGPLERYKKSSFDWYAEVIRTNGASLRPMT